MKRIFWLLLSYWRTRRLRFTSRAQLDAYQQKQLARFTERQNTPGKQWKITPEDWRNREKWGQYEQCVNQMLALTNTEYAPWVAVASNDKKHARIAALEAVVEQIKKYI